MCGITGFLDASARLGRSDALARLQAMSDQLVHRGPDASGHLIEEGSSGGAWCGLGHRRLSILDLSPAGAQPMTSVCGRYTIAYNGEIYNFMDLRNALEAAGYTVWKGRSDTEVLLALIARHGLEKALGRCDGMFALALLDREDRSLTLARDAFGEKPLAYGLWQGVFLFGSELKALRAWPGFCPEEDETARAEFFAYSCIPAPRTIYKNIYKLPPAHLLKVDLDAVRTGVLPDPVRWWDPVSEALSARARGFTGNMAEAVTTIDECLSRSVGRRMVADVPLGALLSGGIDSSLTTALMQAQSEKPIKTFTIGFDEPGYDESSHAEAVARHLGTDHECLLLTSSDVQDSITNISDVYDEPFADSSQVPTHLVSRMARRNVTVVLTGDGGDELFAGYNRHFVAQKLWKRQEHLPHPLRRAIGATIEAVPPGALTGAVNIAGRFAPRDLAAGRAGEKLHKLARLLKAVDFTEFHDCLLQTGNSGSVLSAGSDRTSITSRTDPRLFDLPMAELLMIFDVGHYLHDDVLAKVDRASMAVSLETRTPFLSRELYSLAWSMPMALKANKRTGKLVLRELLDRYIPREVMERPKAGFALPIGRWLRGPLADWAESLLSEDALRATDGLDPTKVRRLWAEHRSGRRDHEGLIWSLLMYQDWWSKERSRNLEKPRAPLSAADAAGC